MTEEVKPKDPKIENYLYEILERISNQEHRRIIQAYRGDNPVQSMETELGKIVMEIVNRED